MKRSCERDGYPPYAFNKGVDGKGAGWIRFVPWADNNGAGKLWKGVCVESNFRSDRAVNGGQVEMTRVNGKKCVRTWTTTTYYTTTLAMTFFMINLLDDDTDLMDENGCLKVGTFDPQPAQYKKAPLKPCSPSSASSDHHRAHTRRVLRRSARRDGLTMCLQTRSLWTREIRPDARRTKS